MHTTLTDHDILYMVREWKPDREQTHFHMELPLGVITPKHLNRYSSGTVQQQYSN